MIGVMKAFHVAGSTECVDFDTYECEGCGDQKREYIPR